MTTGAAPGRRRTVRRGARVALALLLALAAVAVVAVVALQGSGARWATARPWTTTAEGAGPSAVDRLRAWLDARPGDPLVFGDSYTEGIGASSPDTAYVPVLADLLGVPVTADGVGGTGFIATGGTGTTFLDRLSAEPPTTDPVPLLVVQVGLNDARLSPSPDAERTAAVTFLREAAARFPGAQVVLLGPPAVTVFPGASVASVDRALQAAAGTVGVPYISPLQEGWDVNASSADGLHPDDRGHASLAVHLAGALADVLT
ncbi:SGNH/GDSL hydrolase family protein [Klenkia brasiliensis]|uniref:Lysophospholipase L1 n=1 Tax=Klenkia brasiliensis TaxID=333142 RepID=A0A1G7RGM6_9ACTN|nr:SGNH/GDSL hydrolase family protein [Klenkia brasiliensis]SDG09210.1 Lysophospholipase L1 [Klenkia brasiliensis]